jgi:CheY-like chemotaxis protein
MGCTHARTAPCRVLLAEDDADLRELVQEGLREDGYEVVPAQDGAEALRQLDELVPKPCVLLLDLMMPRVSGWQVLSTLEAQGRLDGLPVVVMTAMSGGELPEGIRVLRKPIAWRTLLDAVAESCQPGESRTPD